MIIIDIIQSAYRELNLVPAGAELTQTDIDEAVLVLHLIWRSLFYNVVGANLLDISVVKETHQGKLDAATTAPQVKDGVYPANSRIVMNSTLPAKRYLCDNPRDGTLIGAVSFMNSGNLTVDSNGRYFQPHGRTYVLEPGASVTWMYRADLGMWMTVAWPAETLDTIPFDPRYDDYFICALARRLASRHAVEPSDNAVRTESWLFNEMMRHYKPSRQVIGTSPADLTGSLDLYSEYAPCSEDVV